MAGRLTVRMRRRAVAWVALVVGVTLVHAWVAHRLAASLPAWAGADAAMPTRIEVAFVRELAPQAPAPAPVVVKRRPRARAPVAAAPPPQPVASAPVEAASAPVPAPVEAVASAPAGEPQVDEPAVAEPAVAEPPAVDVAAVAPPAAASTPEPTASAPAFEWPASTQLSYTLHGWFRGEFHGSAQVQWITAGPRYQVNLDVSAWPLFKRRLVSDGELTDQGLRPNRYDEETRVGFMDPRRLTMRFEPGHAVLAGGTRVPAPGDVQDTASQFVQLTWMFITQPQRLRVGESVEVPLALPRRVKRVVFDVVGEETLYTPVGPLDTFHLVPRADARRSSDLTAQVWVAPSLMYLPVRILIHQDAETYMDLGLRTLPRQASAAVSSPAPR
jgi:hypothetical protein